MTLTVEQKIKALQKARVRIKGGSFSICGSLHSVLYRDVSLDTIGGELTLVRKKFKLDRFKPQGKQGNNFWWPLNAYGRTERLRVIDALIAELKVNTNTQSNG